MSSDATKEKEDAARELKLVRRELDDFKRAKKTVKPKQQQNDVRLQRALEEVLECHFILSSKFSNSYFIF